MNVLFGVKLGTGIPMPRSGSNCLVGGGRAGEAGVAFMKPNPGLVGDGRLGDAGVAFMNPNPDPDKSTGWAIAG